MRGRISASMMCAGPFETEKYIKEFEKNNIEYLHLDIMDGSFVPNFTLGTDYAKGIRNITDIPLDIHLMIDKPEDKIDWFDIRKNELVSIHYESTNHVQKTLSKINEKGGLPLLAINPSTPIQALEYSLEDIAGVLVMTVNPGFSGQKMVSQTLKKISDVKELLLKKGFEKAFIQVDGNVSIENACLMRNAGADIFVAGTSSIFTGTFPLEKSVNILRDAIK